MQSLVSNSLLLVILLLSPSLLADNTYFGKALCEVEGYDCLLVGKGQSWQKLWPDEQQRDLVQRLNRTDTRLHRGRQLVVPANIEKLSLFDISPFPSNLSVDHEKTIIVDQTKLAWAAYNEQGKLMKWGPISSGKDYCKDINRSCKTVTGTYYIYSKKDKRCVSNTFPVGRGGSRMPYCMFFFRGYALHGSDYVKGYRDSHGCVRMFTKDAKWLNETFIDLQDVENNQKGTRVIVKKIIEKGA